MEHTGGLYNTESPQKRVLTDETHASQLTASNQGTQSSTLDEDLMLRLKNVGSRIRKSVSQGYSSHSVGAPRVPQITTKLPFTKTSSFRSDSDVLRDVFADADNQPPRTSSVEKRKQLDDEDDFNLSDDDLDMADAEHSLTRPIKPLRQLSKRATQSLPAFGFPSDNAASHEVNMLTLSNAIEEEDWSKENFA